MSDEPVIGERRMAEVRTSKHPDRVEVYLLDGTVRVFEPMRAESGGAQ